jgi:HlyD family secretion protein
MTHSYSTRGLAWSAATVCVVGLGGFLGWSAFAPLQSAVIGAGTVDVEGAIKHVQHPDGGVVAQLPVRDGQSVAAGDLVLLLDDTGLRADLDTIETRLIEIDARRARLLAERDGRDLVFPAALLALAEDAQRGEMAREAMADERILRDGRQAGTQAKIAQLRERIGQLGNEAEGLRAQKAAAERSGELVREELADLHQLLEKSLISRTRVRSVEREAADLEGQLGSLIADLARTEGEASEIRLQILQTEQDTLTGVIEESRTLEAERGELVQRQIAARDKLGRTQMRAPVAGVVHEMAVHTKGGVLQAGQTAMSIVPASGVLMIETRVSPADIDQVAVGDAARLRLSAFNQRQTPEITGTVTHVAADLSHDAETGASWYTLRITPDAVDMAGLQGLVLKPGMPVEVFLLGSERTMLSYLLKPVRDQMQMALRED